MTLITCATHGRSKRTIVCRHIVESLADGQARGFFFTDEEEDEPQAWCEDCEARYVAAGETWTDQVLEYVDPQVLCLHCYRQVKELNGF